MASLTGRIPISGAVPRGRPDLDASSTGIGSDAMCVAQPEVGDERTIETRPHMAAHHGLHARRFGNQADRGFA